MILLDNFCCLCFAFVTPLPGRFLIPPLSHINSYASLEVLSVLPRCQLLEAVAGGVFFPHFRLLCSYICQGGAGPLRFKSQLHLLTY